MFESLAIRVAVGVAATAIVTLPVVTGLVQQHEAPQPAPPGASQEPEQEQAATRPEGTVRVDTAVRTDGSVDVHLGDDGAWLRMEGHDDAGATGGADVSVTDEGMRLELDSAGPDGSGSAGVSMTDEGMRLWFDVDQSP